eukprot:5858097-Pleurochrysis_carterae.AAC.2
MAKEVDRGVIIVESARISAIVEEALEKLSFLASITPDVMAHRDELSQIVGDEITRIIQEQRALERKYEGLIAQRAALKALSNKVNPPLNGKHACASVCANGKVSASAVLRLVLVLML